MTLHSASPISSEGDEPDFSTLIRYWHGESSSQEASQVAAWLSAKPGRAAWYSKLRAGLEAGNWESLPVGKTEQAVKRILDTAAVSAFLVEAQTDRAVHIPERRLPLVRRPAFVVSAVGVACALVAGFFAILPAIKQHTTQAAPRTYTTSAGQRATISLPDGSRMSLAPSTTVSVRGAFGLHHRTVHVSGEAFFAVTGNANIPFIVTTSRTSTQVLGTQFMVREYDGADAAEVVVVEGRVSVSHAQQAKTLNGGDVAFVADSVLTVGRSAAMDHYTDWTHGTLVFHRAPVSTVLATLSRWYGYRFQLADSSMADKNISMTVKIDDASDMLAMLKAGLDVTYRTQDSTVILVPREQSDSGAQQRQRVPPSVPRRTDVFKPLPGQGR